MTLHGVHHIATTTGDARTARREKVSA